MGPKTQELVKVLDELIALLTSDNEQHWSVWMQQARSWIMASDYSGIEKVLQAYGGMGSFNDLLLGYSENDGILQQKKGLRELNDSLEKLRSKAYTLAKEIAHEQ